MWSRLALFMAVGVFLLLPPERAEAATITVNTTADVVADDGQCSLREAITAANNDAASGSTVGECAVGSGPDAITLPAGIYTIGSGLSVLNDLSMTGAEATNTIIQAGSSPGLAGARVFDISQSAEVTISNITVRHGSAINGGGIKNFGTLTLINSTVSFNSSTGGPGGGIYNASGSVTLIGSGQPCA